MHTDQPLLAKFEGSQLETFRRVLVLLLVLFQAVTVITILAFSRITNETVLLEQAQTILSHSTGESVRHTQAFLTSAARSVASTADMYSSGVLNVGDVGRTEQFFINKLDHNGEFAGIYFGSVDGDFLYVAGEADATRGIYRTKHVSRAGTQLWWRDAAGARQGVVADPRDTYDPRSRPWFQRSLAQDGLVWTDPYIFFTAQKLGITVAAPVRGPDAEVIGVIGVDLELEELARFLSDLQVSNSGITFIADYDGLLIASPHILGGAGHAAPVSQLVKLDQIADPVARQALMSIDSAARSNGKSRRSFRVGDVDYISDFVPFELPGGSQWLIGTYAAEDDFLGVIRRNERRNILLAICVLVASMFVGWLIASTAWTPVATLHDQANRDQLTKVFNRHFLTHFADRLFDKARRKNTAISVAIVDIDHFKSINDKLGHAAGDTVIREVAARLQAGLRSDDIVARFGGEEFVIILPGADADASTHVLERIQAELHMNPIATDAGAVEVAFSVGVCEATSDFPDYESVQRAADDALYAAKRGGRDRVVKFRDTIGQSDAA